MHIEQSKIYPPSALGCSYGYLSLFVLAIVVTAIPSDMPVLKQEVATFKNPIRTGMTAIGHIAGSKPRVADTLQIVHKDRPIAISAIHLFP